MPNMPKCLSLSKAYCTFVLNSDTKLWSETACKKDFCTVGNFKKTSNHKNITLY